MNRRQKKKLKRRCGIFRYREYRELRIPPIALTERSDLTSFVPIILGGPIKEFHDAICECLCDHDGINEYHGIVEGDEVQ